MQNVIALIFDFDDTLAPDSTSSFLEHYGVDVANFWQNEVNPLIKNGWDPVPAYLYLMTKKSIEEKSITKDALAAWGKQIKLYNGATRIFSQLISQLESTVPDVRLEFYMVSSGIGEIIRATNIAKYFKSIWACEFHYNEQKEIEFPKRVVSFTDKTRYLFQISKGIVGDRSYNRPFDVNKKYSEEQLRVPLSQMIFVGDGYTDIPCFSLVKKNGGFAFGLYDPQNQDKWGRAWGFIEDGRVSNLLPAEYGQNSALAHSLHMAVNAIADRIKLRNSTFQG